MLLEKSFSTAECLTWHYKFCKFHLQLSSLTCSVCLTRCSWFHDVKWKGCARTIHHITHHLMREWLSSKNYLQNSITMLTLKKSKHVIYEIQRKIKLWLEKTTKCAFPKRWAGMKICHAVEHVKGLKTIFELWFKENPLSWWNLNLDFNATHLISILFWSHKNNLNSSWNMEENL